MQARTFNPRLVNVLAFSFRAPRNTRLAVASKRLHRAMHLKCDKAGPEENEAPATAPSLRISTSLKINHNVRRQ